MSFVIIECTLMGVSNAVILEVYSAEVQKFVQNLAGNNEDYIARILSNVSERCSSNGKFTTIDTDTYNAMKEQSSVMLRIKSTVNYLLLNKNARTRTIVHKD